MKKCIFIIITGIVVTACSDSITTKEETVSYDNTEHMEKTVTAEVDTNEQQVYYPDDINLPDTFEQDAISVVCEKIKSIDFSIKQSPISIIPEDDALYREAYLNVLKSKIPTVNYKGETEYFIDLYKLGVGFDELVESERYSFYYNDLDGDGLPELGIRCIGGYTYILKYEREINEFRVLYGCEAMYVTILGTGQIWYHDGLHVGIIRDEYIILNDNNEWETVFRLEEYYDSEFYCVQFYNDERVDVGEKNWNEITVPFFEATKNAIPSCSLEEIFGDMLRTK